MPTSRAEKEPSPEEPESTVSVYGKGEQDQDDPAPGREKTFFEHAGDLMDEHETLGRLLAK